MSNIVHQIHDRLFRALLSKPDTAATLFRERLPKTIVEQLSSQLPELVEGSFIDGEFRKHLTDRLFKVLTKSGKPAFVYILVEHKSQAGMWVGYQLLRYLVRILEQIIRQLKAGALLPPVFPLIVYHGEGQWKIPAHFAPLWDVDPSWHPLLLDFPFTVVNLGEIEDDALSADDRLRGGLLTLKYAFRTQEQKQVILPIARALRKDLEFAKLVLRYFIQVYKGVDMAYYQEFSEELFPGKAEEYKSIFAQEFIAKGKAIGEIQLLTRQLQQRFHEVPSWAHKQLAQANSATIEIWGMRILDAKSIEDVFRE